MDTEDWKAPACRALICGCVRAEHHHVPPCAGFCEESGKWKPEAWAARFLGSVTHIPHVYQGTMDDSPNSHNGWLYGVAERPSNYFIKEPK